MLQGFLSQNRSSVALVALLLLIAGAVAMSYYARVKRRSRSRQVFQEKLRQHQEALIVQQMSTEKPESEVR